jgi:hypothetical protein
MTIKAIWRCGVAYRDKEKKRLSDKAWREANPEKKRANNKAWREANPEKKRANDKAWYAANPEKKRANNKARYAANPEKAKANAKAWAKANPEKAKANDKAWREANQAQRYLNGCKASGNPCTNKLAEVQKFFDNKPECCQMPGCSRKATCLDHAHIKHGRSGRIRGWLCHGCNVAVGVLETHGDKLKSWVNKGYVAHWIVGIFNDGDKAAE